jgi:hypothetical protein
MSDTIIHIGYPKTATTWFIRKFYPNIKNAGIVYYDDIKFNINHGQEFFKINFRNEILEKEKLVIVTHAFAGLVNLHWEQGRYREFFLKNLKNEFPSASVIIFIRNQLDFIASVYSSYLKRGGSYKIDELFSEKNTNSGSFFSFEYLEYDKLIKTYKEHFGAEKVFVYIYEELLEDNICFLKQFVNEFHFDVNVDDLSFVKSNEKLRKGLISLVRKTNSWKKDGAKPKFNTVNLPFLDIVINNNLEKFNRCKIWGDKLSSELMLGKELSGYIREYYKESNQNLMKCYKLDIAKFNYPL